MPRTTMRWARGLIVSGLALTMISVGAGTSAAAPGTPGTGLSAPDSGAGLPTAATTSAWNWVRSMIGSATPITSDSRIQPAQSYDDDWTGPVRGTFELIGVAAPQIDDPTVVVAGNTSVLSSSEFRGAVSGTVTLPTATNRWIIQAYRIQDGVRHQAPLQALTAPDGTFSIDLGALADPGPGTWGLGVLDAQAGYSSTGTVWPAAGTYQDLEVASFSTTDATYRTGSVPAAADGTFSFPFSSPGVKSFQLVQISTGDVLAEYRPSTGLVRSYGTESALSETTFTYDQALALQSSLVVDDAAIAAELVQGLTAVQTKTGPQAGGFIAASPQLNPGGGEQRYFTGNHAVALYALTSYLRYSGHDPALETKVRSSISAGLAWLEGRRITSGPRAGLYAAGWNNGDLDWAAVEHNLDAWQALSLAAQVLPCAQCQTRADELGAALVSVMWNPQNNRFDQGARADGRDTVDPLDANSWGAIFLTAIGDSGKAGLALGNAENFAVSHDGTDGYLAYRAQPMRPTPVTSVWVEGTAGVALAQARAGDLVGQQVIVDSLALLQQPDGSFPMATAADANASLVIHTSVAATSWFIVASLPLSPDSLWN